MGRISGGRWRGKGAPTVVHGFEIVDQRQDVLVTHRDLLQDRYLVPDLYGDPSAPRNSEAPHLDAKHRRRRWYTHHMFSPSHHPLVDHLGRIISARIDVYAFFNDRV